MRYNLVVIDTETTGLEYDQHRIIQIGVVAIKEQRIVKTWESKLRLIDGEVSAYAMQVNRLDPSDMRSEKYPHPKAVLRKLQEEFLRPGVLLGAHNLSFDLGFLQAEFARHGLPQWQGNFVDSMALGRALLPDLSASLESLARHFRVELTQHHDALADAVATAHVLLHLLDLAQQRGLDPLNLLIERQGRPIRYRPDNARVVTQEEILAELAKIQQQRAAATDTASARSASSGGLFSALRAAVRETVQKMAAPKYPLLPSPREALAYARDHQSGSRFVVRGVSGRDVEVVVKYHPIRSSHPQHRHKLQRYQIFYRHKGQLYPYANAHTEKHQMDGRTLYLWEYHDAYQALSEAALRQWLTKVLAGASQSIVG
ncbi:3'-5' exonuclease [Symbiobacterium thermophilum]|nr:3'-5' exonuclease [Symbiobacterium thermophilum]